MFSFFKKKTTLSEQNPENNRVDDIEIEESIYDSVKYDDIILLRNDQHESAANIYKVIEKNKLGVACIDLKGNFSSYMKDGWGLKKAIIIPQKYWNDLKKN